MSYPTFEEFLSLPAEEMAKVAPSSVCFVPSGTRRAAALQGIDPRSEQYREWGFSEELRCLDILFGHGVRNVFAPILVPNNFKQDYHFANRILNVAIETITSDQAFAHYRKNAWSVRLLCDDRDDELAKVALNLQTSTDGSGKRNLYWMISKTPTDFMDIIIRKASLCGAKSQQEAIRAAFGEDVEPITMLLAFGKLMVNGEIVPLALMGNLHCYWDQRPGYTLTDQSFKTILYDYAYLRQTSNYPKGDRAMQALQYADVWDSAPMIGLGMRLGQFWFPAPMKSPAWKEND